MGVPAGFFRHRVAIQRNVPTIGAGGVRRDNWITVEGLGKVPARITFSSAAFSGAREFIAAQEMQSQIVGKVMIRWRPGDFTGALRIVHNNRLFDAKGFFPDNYSGMQTLTAIVTEGVNNG